MTDAVTLLTLTRVEGAHLARLIDDFRELIASSLPSEDPAVDRLTPDAYPSDPEASIAFAESTRSELLDRREEDAAIVRSALERFTEPFEGEDEALAPMDAVIPQSALSAWLRTLAAIRLVLASRLGVTEESQLDDPRFGVYNWLGFRLDGLVDAAERLN